MKNLTKIAIIAVLGLLVAITGQAYTARVDGVTEQTHTEQDIAELRRSANRGNAIAQNNLGVAYADGNGVEQDHAEAAKWFRKAAEQGNATAQFHLGISYFLGEGVPQNYSEAVKWYRKAAEQGNANAQYSLGSLHKQGIIVAHDLVSAHAWYNLAAAQGHEDAKNERDKIAKEMTWEQILEAQKKAAEWKKQRKRGN